MCVCSFSNDPQIKPGTGWPGQHLTSWKDTRSKGSLGKSKISRVGHLSQLHVFLRMICELTLKCLHFGRICNAFNGAEEQTILK